MAGAGLPGFSAVDWSSGASSFPSTACSGGDSGYPSVSSRRRGDVGVIRLGATLRSPSIQLSSQCVIICLA